MDGISLSTFKSEFNPFLPWSLVKKIALNSCVPILNCKTMLKHIWEVIMQVKGNEIYEILTQLLACGIPR